MNQKGTVQIIGIILAVIAAVAGAALFSKAWSPSWSPFRPDPEKVVKEAVFNMKELESLKSTLDFQIAALEKDLSLEGQMETDWEKTESGNRLASDFKFSLKTEGSPVSLQGSSITTEERSYVKIAALPDLPLFGAYLQVLGIDSSKIEGQWISFESGILEEWLERMGSVQRLSPMGADSPEQEKGAQLNLKEKISGLFGKESLYLVQEELPDRKIGKEECYHYSVFLSRDVLKEAFLQLGEEYLEYLGVKDKKAALGEMEEAVQNYFKKTGDIEAEVWIGKKDRLVYRIKTEKEAEINQTGFVFKLEADFSEFNNSFGIIPPKDSLGLEEIISFPARERTFSPYPLQKGETFQRKGN